MRDWTMSIKEHRGIFEEQEIVPGVKIGPAQGPRLGSWLVFIHPAVLVAGG